MGLSVQNFDRYQEGKSDYLFVKGNIFSVVFVWEVVLFACLFIVESCFLRRNREITW